MSKDLTISELESWLPLLEMFSDKHVILHGAAGESAMDVGDVLEIIRSHIVCRAVTVACCNRRASSFARPEALSATIVEGVPQDYRDRVIDQCINRIGGSTFMDHPRTNETVRACLALLADMKGNKLAEELARIAAIPQRRGNDG